MNNILMFNLIKNAYINNRYTLENVRNFTLVKTIDINQYKDITGLEYDTATEK